MNSSGARSVVVAMSGGVDSSVAAHMLSQQGYSLVGVSMQVWDYKKNSGSNSRATCCSPADFCDARMVASSLDFPFYVVDFEKTFQQEVIDRFVDTYKRGLTPNPCIDCNTKVKFRALRDRAKGFGCDYVATGHYARIKKSEEGFHLLRGKDRDKDQSYFLYTIEQGELAETLFPVGDYTKPEIRELAREVGLVTANKPESQDICFVAGSVSDFVVKIGGASRQRGSFVTKDGVKVGEHTGIHQFTVGQRRGLHLGGFAEPLYVIRLDASSNTVVVGTKDELKREGFGVEETHWVSPACIDRRTRGEKIQMDVIVQVRSRHEGTRAHLSVSEEGQVDIAWTDEWVPVSPGQAAVFYDLTNEEVLGGGRIASSITR